MKNAALGVFVLAVFIAGACGPKDQPLGALQAQSAGDALGNGVEDAALSFGPVDSGSAFTTSNACITLSGDTSDADGDNIPADATLTFTCTETRLGYTGALTGTMNATDDQPASIAWAFTATIDLHASLTGPGGGSITRDRDGQWIASQDSVAGPFHLDRTLDLVTVFTGDGGGTRTVTEAVDWNVTFTPQFTWTPGSIVVTGALAVDGTWNVTMGAKSADATVATPTALTLDPACETRITAGTLVATYEGGGTTRTITVTWTACGQRTVVYAEQ